MDELLNDPTLVDPDGEEENRYAWDEEFQRHVIALLIADRQFLLQSLDLIRPSYFTNKAHQKVCGIVFDFFKKYHILPRKDFVVQEIKSDSKLRENKSLPFYLAELNVLYDYFKPGLEARDYLQNKIVSFAKIQAVKKAFHDSLKVIGSDPESEETWEKVYDKMRDAMTTHQNFEVGTDYFNSIQERYVKKEVDDEKDTFVTGLDQIDKEINGGGYIRGEIISVVAGSGVGKSVMLACVTATNLLRGKKGVYISLELAESKIADRFDAILTGFPVQRLFEHKDDVIGKLETMDGIWRPEKGLGALIIKEFPAGTATVNTIRAYLAQLRFRGYEPDFVIVDYIGEMADIPDMPLHQSREKTVRQLRAMASEEKVFVAVAMQPNRDYKKDGKQSGERARIDDEHLADSYGQIRPLDGCFSLNQNDTEKKLGLGRCYVIKQRDGKSRYQFHLQFDQFNLRITEISKDTYKIKLNTSIEMTEEETLVDKVKDGWKDVMEEPDLPEPEEPEEPEDAKDD